MNEFLLILQTTSTQIKVYGTCCPRSTDRVVAVSGPVEMVLNAVKEIALLVLEVCLPQCFPPFHVTVSRPYMKVLLYLEPN